MNYKLKLEVFEGPLDLLLYLIKKNDIEIKDIPITEITEQYMEYIEVMELLDLNMVGDFLVMAATLMQIKSRMLLPPNPEEVQEEEEDPRDELAQRLLEYQRFKEIAGDLKEKEMYRKDFVSRQVNEDAQNQLREDAKEVFFEANLFDLISALSHALQKVPENKTHEITRENFTVEEKIHDILHLLIEKSSIQLAELFAKSVNKFEMIVTFLSVLELIRLKEIKILQKRLFSDIEIQRNKDNITPEEK